MRGYSCGVGRSVADWDAAGKESEFGIEIRIFGRRGSWMTLDESHLGLVVVFGGLGVSFFIG
ncbi:hypothetical protein B1219_24575 [Pseudomonas ogarae]|nr:hypothetical protein B1219_24575 [Pseudomonas ogarae]OPG77535.1 hypothetical protein B1218_20260 [Pseudomonas ogarae]